MNRLRRPFYSVLSLMLIMQLTFATQAFAAPASTSAQEPKQIEQQRLTRVMDPNTNVEEFRQELTNYFTEMEEVVRLLNEIPAVRQKLDQNNLQTIETLAAAKQQILQASPEELSQIRAAYAKFPGWREAPRTFSSLIKPELRGQLETRKAAKQNGGEYGANAVTPDNCQDGINADPSNTDIAAAKTALIAAQAAASIIPAVLNAPAVAAASIAQGVVLSLETLKAIKDDCTGLDAAAVTGIVNTAKTDIINNDNSNKTSIISSISANTTAITGAVSAGDSSVINNDNANKALIINNDNTNTTNIVNNDNANKTAITTAISSSQTTIVNNDNANTTTITTKNDTNTAALKAEILAARAEMLRSQIEADLATESSGVKVAWYMTPTAKGGHLDLVQSIVTETLANIQAAGGSIGNAQSFLNSANADKAAGNFKSAYDNYRKAYKAAAS